MAEERMLSDEVLLALIKKNSGGGGTSNYNELSNQPQVNGNTLVGNKSASDLGLVAAENGKVLSTNDYTDADKAIVGGVTSALAGKQDALTAGDYISLNNGNIAVNRNIIRDNYDYEIKSNGDWELTIIKSQGGTVISTNTYSYGFGTSFNIDNNFTIEGGYDGGNAWVYTALKDSSTHSAGYTWTKLVRETFDVTEAFPTEDLSGYKLIIKSEMDAALADKQDTLTFDNVPTDGSNNPVKSDGIYDALATKQNASGNSALDTTDKTIVGAINEVNSNLTSLGLSVINGKLCQTYSV